MSLPFVKQKVNLDDPSVLKIFTAEVFIPLLTPKSDGGPRYKGAHGGRGSAKSHFFAESIIERSLKQKTDIVCIRETQKSLDQSVKRLVESKIEKFRVGDRFTVLRTHIESDLGGRIIFQGMQNHTSDSVKSLEAYDIAYVEEAQNLSERSLSLLRPTIRKPGSEIWAAWNPRFANDPIEKLLRGPGRYPDSAVVESNWQNNPWFPPDLKAELEYDRGRDLDKYEHVWMGGYQKSSTSRVFNNWRVEEVDEPGDDTRFYMGADWGFSVDPSVLIRAYFPGGRRMVIDREAYRVGCPIDGLPSLFDALDSGRPGMARNWPITADSARPETIDYMVRHGYPRMTAALKGANSVQDGIEFMKNYEIIVHPRCVHTIDELTFYSWKVDPQTEEVLPVLDDKKNHVIDACRYAVEGKRRGSYTLDNI